jgi:hypothetical protein
MRARSVSTELEEPPSDAEAGGENPSNNAAATPKVNHRTNGRASGGALEWRRFGWGRTDPIASSSVSRGKRHSCRLRGSGSVINYLDVSLRNWCTGKQEQLAGL